MDLAYQGMKESELAFEKAKAKFALLRQKQSDVKALRVGKNLVTGQMVMETGTIMYGYAGRALITTFHADKKVKPKGEDGSKLLLVHSRTENPLALTTGGSSFFGQTKASNKITSTTGSLRKISYNVGDVLALVYDKSGTPFQKYTFLVYDAKELTRKHTREIVFDKAYRPIYARDMPNGDMAFIFAPIMSGDIAKSKKMKAVNTHQTPSFKYLRIDTKGETVAEVHFDLPKPKMGMPYTLALIPASDPADLSTYLVGYGGPELLGMGVTESLAAAAAITNNDLPRQTNMTAGKLNSVVMGHLTDKLEFFNTLSPQEFWQKAKVAPGSKAKVPAGSDAAKFFLSLVHFMAAEEINGQHYLVGGSRVRGDLFTVQMDSKGQIQNVYFDNRGKVHYIEAGLRASDSGDLWWLFTHQAAAKTAAEAAENNYKRSFEAIRLQPQAGTLSAAQSLRPKKHYVDLTQPIQFISAQEAIVLGHTSRKDLTLARVKF